LSKPNLHKDGERPITSNEAKLNPVYTLSSFGAFTDGYSQNQPGTELHIKKAIGTITLGWGIG
jgi:hypothetical protein